jgi:nicotinamide-nucleotide amidase
MSFREKNLNLAEKLVNELKSRKAFITMVESCTGGALANSITNIEGAGDVMKDGFVTYSNEAKIALGVPKQIIDTHSVYSKETAVAMAEAGMTRSVGADVSVAITGTIAKADPSNPNSKPGEIFVAVKSRDHLSARLLKINAQERIDAKDEIIHHALNLILESLDR